MRNLGLVTYISGSIGCLSSLSQRRKTPSPPRRTSSFQVQTARHTVRPEATRLPRSPVRLTLGVRVPRHSGGAGSPGFPGKGLGSGGGGRGSVTPQKAERVGGTSAGTPPSLGQVSHAPAVRWAGA